MLNLQKLFTDFESIAQSLKLRKISKEQLLIIREKIAKKKDLESKFNNLSHERNQLSQKREKSAEKVKKIKQSINLSEKCLNELKEELIKLTSQLPNLPALDSPSNEEGNKIINSTTYQHNIQHNLTHEKILNKLKIIDEEKSIKLSGSKFVVYQDFGSRLLHALINFMLNENSQRGYQLFTTPYLVNGYNLYNTGQFHKFQDSLYKIEESGFYLIPTAEVSLVNLYQNQILTEEQLPLNLCAYSPCFRAERMAAGRENKGLIRLHQFHKVELVKIVKPEDSYLELEKLVTAARNILHLLKIPHQVINLCPQELAFSATKTYDIEVWLPVSKKWLEISSCSNCEDFQSRRSLIRVISKEKKKYYPHTLNGSALAIDRLITVLCEYYYDEKTNKLVLPAILEKYFILQPKH